MRRLREGDKVQAFLNAKIKGTIVKVVTDQSRIMMTEGVPSTVSIAVVDLGNGQFVNIGLSELYYIG